MVSFGRELGLQITAEGIEDLETAEWLASLGCPYGQGYLFSRPLSADAASEMLREKDNVAAESRLALLMKVA
jgi:EAL domain-containing protein (putative c-di-GMP-specific phosphodiesterase class I)